MLHKDILNKRGPRIVTRGTPDKISTQQPKEEPTLVLSLGFDR